MGAYWGILKYDFILSVKTVIMLAVITVVMYIMSIIFYDTTHGVIQKIWLFLGSFSLISIINYFVKFVKLPNILFKVSGCSYFIYLSHKLGFTYIAKYPFSWFHPSEFILIMKFLVAPFITVFLCCWVYQVCNKYFPKSFSIVIGKKIK